MPTRRITWGEQQRLRELVEGWVGREDMQRSEKLWVAKAIRNYPSETEQSVGQMRMLEQSRPGYFHDQAHKIKVLMIDLRKSIGVKSWSDVRPGPEPIVQ